MTKRFALIGLVAVLVAALAGIIINRLTSSTAGRRQLAPATTAAATGSSPTTTSVQPGAPTSTAAGTVPVSCARGNGPVNNVVDFGATGNGVANDSSAFQHAVQAAASDRGYVYVPPPTVSYRLDQYVQLRTGVMIIGGPELPLITGGVQKSYMFLIVGVDHAGLSCLHLDPGNVEYTSGVDVRHTQNVTLSSLDVTDVNAGWGILVGTDMANNTTVANNDVTISNSNFEDFDSKLEEILVFNSDDVTITDCHLAKTVYYPSGGGLGLYQNDDGVTVTDNTFGPDIGNSGSYYSVTVDHVVYAHNTFIGDGSAQGNGAIVGANSSDHGLFGKTTAVGYQIIDNRFEGYAIALQLGAVTDATVEGNVYEHNNTAVAVNDGNLYFPTKVAYPDRDVIIVGNTFEDNGTGTPPVAGSAQASVLFSKGGGSLSLSMTLNDFNGGSGTTAPMVLFSGPYTWSDITISSNTFAGPSSQFVEFHRGAQLGPGTQVENA